jgi:thiamine pyrophosphokinase
MLKNWAKSAEFIVAADGAADMLLSAGFFPNFIVGDLDSASQEALECGAEIVKISDQNYTDADKLLRFVQGAGLVPITLIGLEGDRIDHVLGNLHSVAASGIAADVSLIYRQCKGFVVGKGIHVKSVQVGARVSLIPLQRTLVASSEGLKWPLMGLVLEAGVFESISNIATEASIRIDILSGVILICLQSDVGEPNW